MRGPDVGRSLQTGALLAVLVPVLALTGLLLSPTVTSALPALASAQATFANPLYVAHVTAGVLLGAVVVLHLFPFRHAFVKRPALSWTMYVVGQALVALVLVEVVTGLVLWWHAYAVLGKAAAVAVHLGTTFLVLVPFSIHALRGLRLARQRRGAAEVALEAATKAGRREAALEARGRVTRRAFVRLASLAVAGLAVAAAVGRFATDQVMAWRLNSVGKVPALTKEGWRLRVTGLVARPVELTWDDLQALPQTTLRFTHHCVEGWTYTDTFTGVALPHVLAAAGGPKEGAKQLIFKSPEVSEQRWARGQLYTTNFPVEDGLHDDVLLVHKVAGRDLPPEHGFPVRLMTPRKWGYKACKWLTEIEVTADADYQGYWERGGYHNDGDYPGPIFAPGSGRF